MGWEKKICKARKLHRPSLKNWECDGLAGVFSSFVSSLSDEYESFVLNNDNSSDDNSGQKDNNGKSSTKSLPVVLNGESLSCEEFFTQYEIPCIPCIIRGIPYGQDGGTEGDEWPAVRKWTLEALEKDGVLSERKYKCGEDDEGYSIKVKMSHFIKYLHTNRDDSPLYIFDRAFEDDKHAKRILNDYTVPSYFKDDLFRLASERSRPPYRWFLIGPERSGTTVHIDPLATSAWNTLIVGKKRWVLFPPHVPKSVVKGKGLVGDDEDDEAIHYFMYILPRIKRKALEEAAKTAAAASDDQYASYQNNNTHSKSRHSSSSSSYDYKNFACYEFTQHAGETVYIPHDWWHAVLNLTHTVGVTQNFCSQQNFDEVWIKTRSGRKKLAYKWLMQLKEHYPHLYNRAREMNRQDNFKMKYEKDEDENELLNDNHPSSREKEALPTKRKTVVEDDVTTTETTTKVTTATTTTATANTTATTTSSIPSSAFRTIQLSSSDEEKDNEDYSPMMSHNKRSRSSSSLTATTRTVSPS